MFVLWNSVLVMVNYTEEILRRHRMPQVFFYTMLTIPNLLLIAGTGNKSGKTTLACRVIEQFRQCGITAVKITPHFHETTPGLLLVSENKGYSIYEELDSQSGKDTSRMLSAGAQKVYFAKVTDNNLLNAFTEIIRFVPDGTPIVCESPGLRYFLDPAIFIIMKEEGADNNKDINKLLKLPHVLMKLNDLNKIERLPFSFSNGKWSFNTLFD